MALAVSVAGSGGLAAADEPATLESSEWHLVWYAGAADLEAVPWSVDATLLLEDGRASGVAGCNSFSGNYTLEGESLTFDGPLEVTEMACPSPQADVEAGYLAALPQVDTWSIDDSLVGNDAALELNDADGQTLLVFALPVMELTQADVSDLARRLDEQQAAIERLDERMDNVRIGTLRERIKTLETQVRTLRAQQAASSSGSSGSANTSAMNAAERVLLGAVRADIARTCEPRRTQNPAGTIAALQCQPNAPEVRDMAYYLMESDDAWKVYRRRMQDNKVRNGTGNRACAFNKPSQMAWVGGGIVNAGCYRDDNGRANLRFVNTLADCRQLTAGATQVESPSVYIAVLGPDRDIASLWGWAASSTDWEAGEDLFDPIKQPGQPWSDQCPHG